MAGGDGDRIGPGRQGEAQQQGDEGDEATTGCSHGMGIPSMLSVGVRGLRVIVRPDRSLHYKKMTAARSEPEPGRTLCRVPPGKPGRPRALVKSVSVSTFLKTPDLDALCRLASRSGVSVSACIRTLLTRELRTMREGNTEKLEK